MMHRWTDDGARRASWRVRRAQRRTLRAQRRAVRWASWGPWGDGLGGDGCGADMDATAQDGAMDEAIAGMQQTIDALNARVAVLEKLATGADAKLAAEIEQLRGDAQRETI